MGRLVRSVGDWNVFEGNKGVSQLTVEEKQGIYIVGADGPYSLSHKAGTVKSFKQTVRQLFPSPVIMDMSQICHVDANRGVLALFEINRDAFLGGHEFFVSGLTGREPHKLVRKLFDEYLLGTLFSLYNQPVEVVLQCVKNGYREIAGSSRGEYARGQPGRVIAYSMRKPTRVRADYGSIDRLAS